MDLRFSRTGCLDWKASRRTHGAGISDESFELSGPLASFLSMKNRLKCVERAKSTARYVTIEQVRNRLDLPHVSRRMTPDDFRRDVFTTRENSSTRARGARAARWT